MGARYHLTYFVKHIKNFSKKPEGLISLQQNQSVGTPDEQDIQVA
jgi:hypothetical protein